MTNVESVIDLLINNDEIKEIFNKIDNSLKFATFYDKKDILTSFNNALNKIFHSPNIKLFVDKENSKSSLVTANEINAAIQVNLNSDNPYLYLENIIFYHLALTQPDTYESISVGEIEYYNNFTFDIPSIAGYNKNNIKNKIVSAKVVSTLLENYDNKFKDNFLLSLDNNLTSDIVEDLLAANKIMEKNKLLNGYDELKGVSDDISKLINKDVDDESLLAMFSIDNVLLDLCCRDFKSKKLLNSNMKKFIDTFFKEYSKFLKFRIINGYVYINNYKVNDNELFIDALFKQIENIDRNIFISDYLISDDNFNKLNNMSSHKFTKLEAYFYLKCKSLDKALENKNCQIINYSPYTGFFKFNDDIDLYKDKANVFEKLLDNKDFINTCTNFIISVEFNEKELNKIFNYLNKAYGKTHFKLKVNEVEDIDSILGATGDTTISLNVATSSNQEVLGTFLHEYRHLVQKEESIENTGIFNDYLYEYIKKQETDSPFGTDIAYNYFENSGYSNQFFYDLEPVEFDAENFSRHMLSEIIKRSKADIYLDEEQYNLNYKREFKYFSNQKLSFKIYDYSYEFYEIEKTIKNDKEAYKKLDNKIKKVSIDTVKEIYKMDGFNLMPINKRIKVYKTILLDPGSLKKIKGNNYKINDNVYDLDKLDIYQVLEQCLISNSKVLFKEGKLKVKEIANYIYNESLKYKIDKNQCNLYNMDLYNSFHKFFNRYKLINNRELKKDKKETKAR